MTTMIVNIRKNADVRNIVAAVRLFKGVTGVKVQENAEFEQIPGLPYTHEEYLADICMAEEDYAMGRTTTSEILKKRIAVW